MNEKLDLTKILKDCITGTEFYSRFLGYVEFYKITFDNYIEVRDKNGYHVRFKPNGTYLYSEEGTEIDLFPSKDQRDWSKWHRPFVDGDVLATNSGMWIGIVKDYMGCCQYKVHAAIDGMDNLCIGNTLYLDRPATEEEKQEFFDVIKNKGYKWNNKTKTLEKLIVPKFKVGDKIRHRLTGKVYMVLLVLSNGEGGGVYDVAVTKEIGKTIDIKEQDNYELLPNKFDPKTLQPFDKVLARDLEEQSWDACIYSHMNECEYYPFTASLIKWRYCIPYNDDTKHLVGKSDEAPAFYRYWEE